MSKTYRVKLRRPKAFGGTDHAAGDVIEVPLNWARRWISAGAAELVKGEEALPTVEPLSTTDMVTHGDPGPVRKRGGKK